VLISKALIDAIRTSRLSMPGECAEGFYPGDSLAIKISFAA